MLEFPWHMLSRTEPPMLNKLAHLKSISFMYSAPLNLFWKSSNVYFVRTVGNCAGNYKIEKHRYHLGFNFGGPMSSPSSIWSPFAKKTCLGINIKSE